MESVGKGSFEHSKLILFRLSGLVYVKVLRHVHLYQFIDGLSLRELPHIYSLIIVFLSSSKQFLFVFTITFSCITFLFIIFSSQVHTSFGFALKTQTNFGLSSHFTNLTTMFACMLSIKGPTFTVWHF